MSTPPPIRPSTGIIFSASKVETSIFLSDERPTSSGRPLHRNPFECYLACLDDCRLLLLQFHLLLCCCSTSFSASSPHQQHTVHLTTHGRRGRRRHFSGILLRSTDYLFIHGGYIVPHLGVGVCRFIFPPHQGEIVRAELPCSAFPLSKHPALVPGDAAWCTRSSSSRGEGLVGGGWKNKNRVEVNDSGGDEELGGTTQQKTRTPTTRNSPFQVLLLRLLRLLLIHCWLMIHLVCCYRRNMYVRWSRQATIRHSVLLDERATAEELF